MASQIVLLLASRGFVVQLYSTMCTRLEDFDAFGGVQKMQLDRGVVIIVIIIISIIVPSELRQALISSLERVGHASTYTEIGRHGKHGHHDGATCSPKLYKRNSLSRDRACESRFRHLFDRDQ